MRLPMILACLPFLVAAAAPVRERPPELDERGRQMHRAAREGHTETVSRLLEEGVPVDVADAQYRTPLHLASEYHQTDVIRVLLDAGADVNARDGTGQTPLVRMLASQRMAQPGAVDALLVAEGVDINAADHGGTRRCPSCRSSATLSCQAGCWRWARPTRCSPPPRAGTSRPLKI